MTKKKAEKHFTNLVIEFEIDCGNCTMSKDEIAWFTHEIEKLCEQRNSKLNKINIYD